MKLNRKIHVHGFSDIKRLKLNKFKYIHIKNVSTCKEAGRYVSSGARTVDLLRVS